MPERARRGRPYTLLSHAVHWEGTGATRPDRHPQRRPGGASRCGEDHAGRGPAGGDRVPAPPGVGGEGHHRDGLRARGDGAPAVDLDRAGLLRGERGQGQPAGHTRVRRLRRRDADRPGQRRPGRRRGERHRRRAGPDRGRLAGGGPPRAAPGHRDQQARPRAGRLRPHPGRHPGHLRGRGGPGRAAHRARGRLPRRDRPARRHRHPLRHAGGRQRRRRHGTADRSRGTRSPTTWSTRSTPCTSSWSRASWWATTT